MKPYLPILLLTAAVASTSAQAVELVVRVTDIRTAKGNIGIAVVDSEAGWSNQSKPAAAQLVAASGEEVTFRFDLPAGAYAVRVMHDENGNGKLDTNILGIPTEGYGFSNNLKVMRVVRFDEARFELGSAGTTVVVNLR